MIFKELSPGLKIGIISSLIPLLVGLFDFLIVCQAGANEGEGCGIFLLFTSLFIFFPLMRIISLPAIFLINLVEPIFGPLFPLYYLTNVLSLALIYFFVGFLAGKAVEKIKARKNASGHKV